MKYGAYAHLYKRNKQTTWYLIYDVDAQSNVLVNKIVSNHVTNS